MAKGKPLHIYGWLGWVLVAAWLATRLRNPFYTLLILLIARLVWAGCSRPEHSFNLPFAKLAFFIPTFSALLNGLLAHTGQTVLLIVPAGWPLIGGPLTLEALVYGFNNGLILLTILAIFQAFNAIVPISQLIRLAPAAFYNLGLVLLIALTYVPQTLSHLQQIREAQAIRGHRLRGWRDWRPVVLPLLVGGLERAMNLAETMMARGYGASSGRSHSGPMLAGLAGGLTLTLLGWLLLLWQLRPGWGILLAGVGLIGWLVWRSGRDTPTTRYQPQPWQPRDTLFLLCNFIPILAALNPANLSYSPYPLLQLPPFASLTGLALLFLLFPLLTGRVLP